MHKICVLHFDEIWPEGFTCDTCLKKSGRKKKKNKFTAKRLQQSKLGQHIENRVNKLLRSKKCEAGAIAIRVVSSLEKFAKVEPGMRARYVDAGKFPERFPYRAKALFAFEEIDEVDTCFFGMHVQEYGSECSPPNKRRVYISYLDSVHFFTSKQYRTAVYHEILLGYLDYVKQLGYTMAHIWACPPIEGDDYIFHSHPKEQKVPSSQQLEKWYKKMLDKGIAEQIVLGYKDILAQAIEDNIKSPSDLPYFDGDMWPLVLEESIRDMDDEEKRQMSEVTAASAAENEDEDSIYEILTQLTPDEFKSFFELPLINRDDSPKRVNSASAAAVEDIVNDKDEEIRNKILLGKVFPIMEKYKEVIISYMFGIF
ncbi:CREB-binding protein-like [Uloborus diversus]|uniref:CREB-binding protein-like n=1 Tax=Uloborus diversus TaxID=327109 RepID=UPI0024093118|nr:CREB-binding protein-like [Uloborus diversus]